MGAPRRDRRAFEKVWNSIILPGIERYCAESVTVTCTRKESTKTKLREAYNVFNVECSEHYMSDVRKPLNQRKIAACYAQAIVSVRPLDIDIADVASTEPPIREGRTAYECRPCFANERLAIYTACSILTSFLRKAVDDDRCELTNEEKEEAHVYIGKGVNLLQSVDGGEFVLNLERTLSFMSLDENYNTPLLACLFSYWEAQVLPPEYYREVLRVFLLESNRSD